MERISKEPGVYLGGARNGTGAHHMFVLNVRNCKVYVFDESLGTMDKLASRNTLSWIVEWKLILKGTRRSRCDK